MDAAFWRAMFDKIMRGAGDPQQVADLIGVSSAAKTQSPLYDSALMRSWQFAMQWLGLSACSNGRSARYQTAPTTGK